jgi:hypothetical protein
VTWVWYVEFRWEAGWPGSEGRTETQYERAEVMAYSVGHVEEMLADWIGYPEVTEVRRLRQVTHDGQQIVLLTDDDED